MWYTWTTVLLVSCALVKADGEAGAGAESPAPVATTRAPPRTLDRKAAELVWRSWLESSEGNAQNGPPRRITTKSLFITPLVCPKGQRLDRNACIQVVTVNKDEHERILLESLNALFTTPPNDGHVNTDVLYDYGDEDPGPLQLSLPINFGPQASPLQGQEPSAQAQQLQPSYVKIDKKDENKQTDSEASIEAELELLRLQNSLNQNDTSANTGSVILNQNVLTNSHIYAEKPKRDSPIANSTEIESINNTTDQGQKELVYGHVNVDPILYNSENHDSVDDNEKHSNTTEMENGAISLKETINKNITMPTLGATTVLNDNKTDKASNVSTQILKKDGEQNKLNPENDYSDIGEAIKLISRYADVTTDDNYAKVQNNNGLKEDSILGTRTKMQYRRNKPKEQQMNAPAPGPQEMVYNDKTPSHNVYQTGVYYRYPWQSQHTQTPPPDYPFRHLQDYWPGRNQIGGVYNIHENPRRHHHSYPHNFRAHGFPQASFRVPAYPEQLKGYIRRVVQHHANAMRPHTGNQDLYSLLGLRHWFSSEGTSKR